MGKITGREKINPSQYHVISTINDKPEAEYIDIYVDASHKETRTGIGICWKEIDGTIRTKQVKIEGVEDTHTAELVAIQEGIEIGTNKVKKNIRILTDRKGALNTIKTINGKNKIALRIQRRIIAETKNNKSIKIKWIERKQNELIKQAHKEAKKARGKATTDRTVMRSNIELKKAKTLLSTNIMKSWQEKWDKGSTGRTLYQHIKEVSRDQIEISFKSAQLITGHGNMGQYLKRFKLTNTNGICECTLNEDETADHILYRCQKENRKQAREEIETRYGDLSLDLRNKNVNIVDNVKKLNEWAERVLEKECMIGNCSENESSE